MNLRFHCVTLNRDATSDLLGIWVISFVAFIYVGIPWGNSALLSTAIATQASLGVLVVSQVLKELRLSILVISGPGLIVGGAVSVFLYYVAGRGMFGALIVTAVGFFALRSVTTGKSVSITQPARLWSGAVLLGFASLAISWEHPVFLVPGVVLLATGVVCQRWIQVRSFGATLMIVLVGAVSIVTVFLREEMWWLVTDDFLFLEVLAQHLVRSGPLQDWGVLNWTSYHWLSYGWSGLLNELGGRPELLVTLTRVMPVIYSISFGASLMALVQTLNSQTYSRSWLVILSAVQVLMNRLDWTGTSTAGAFTVVVGTLHLLLLMVEQQVSSTRRLAIYVGVAILVGLTKFPSVLVLIPLIVIAERFVRVSSDGTQFNSRQNLKVVLLGIFLSVTAIAVFGELLGRFIFTPLYPDFGYVNPRAPVAYAITQSGVFQTFVAVVLTRLWLLLALAIVVVTYRNSISESKKYLLFALSSMALLGVITDTFVFGDSNSHEYFSGPSYLIGTLALSFVAQPSQQLGRLSIRRLALLGGGALSFAVIWQYLGISLSEFGPSETSAVLEIILDRRLGAVLFILAMALLFRTDSKISLAMPKVLVVVILTFHLSDRFSTFADRLGTQRSAGNVSQILGPPEVIATGQWISENVPKNDRLATNYILVQPPESNYADWGLAAWSNREFLVLDVDGPWFDESSSQHIRARYLSEAFAESPSIELAKELVANDVRWFVVDRRTTNQLTWYPFASARFAYEHFVVLQLNDTLN